MGFIHKNRGSLARVRSNHIVILLLTLSLLLSGCRDDQLRKAARASDDIAQVISAAIEVKRSLAQQGLISKEEELRLTIGMQKVNQAAKLFNEQARRFKSMDEPSRQTLLALFSNITSYIEDLNQSNLLIKNPQARDRLAAILAGLDASIQAINLAFQGGQ